MFDGDASLLSQRILSQPVQNQARLYPQTSQMAVNVRRRLGQLARCPGPASQEAIALAQAISLVLNELCPVKDGNENFFTWALDTNVEEIITGTPALQSQPAPAQPDRIESGFSNYSAPRQAVNMGPMELQDDMSREKNPDPNLVTLRAHFDKGCWKMHPASLDAILSLWMSSLAMSGQVGANDIIHRDTKSRDEDAEDVEVGNWLSRLASATVKYRRILGEDPARYEPQSLLRVSAASVVTSAVKHGKVDTIRTDILTRDLCWWTGDPRIRAFRGEAALLQDTTNVILEIGFNGLEPRHETEAKPVKDEAHRPKGLMIPQNSEVAQVRHAQPEVVPIVSNGPLATVLSHHLFSAFMWAVSHYIQEDKLDAATVEDAELFDSSKLHKTWNIPTLRNKELMKLARAIAGFGLGPIDDVLLGIIPPLSHRGILPNEAMMGVLLAKAKEHEKYHDWDQAQEAYCHLMELPLHPHRMDRISYQVIVEIVEFLFLAGDTVADLDVVAGPQVGAVSEKEKAVVSAQGESLRHAVKAISTRLQAHDLILKKFEELRWFYLKQRRSNKYDRLYQSLKSIQRARAPNSSTKEDGQPKEPVRANEHALENSHIDSSAQVVTKPDKDLLKLTKFTSRHARASRWRKDPKPSNLVDESNEVGKQDIFGWYPLHYATVNDGGEVFEDILKGCSSKAQHELKDRSERTPLHYAAMYAPGRIKRLIGNEQKGKSAANTRGRDGTSPIHCAARSANMESVDQLSKYSNPAALDAFNRSPLHLGVIIGNRSVVDHFAKAANVAIIQTGAELFGRTALHLALVASKFRKNKSQEMRDIITTLTTREKDLRAMSIVDEVDASPITWALNSKDPEDEKFIENIVAKLLNVERQQSEDGQSNVASECFRSILYDAVRLGSEFALTLTFRHIKNWSLDLDWIRDTFRTAQKLQRDDMLLLMLGIVDRLIPKSDVERKSIPSDGKATILPDDEVQSIPPTHGDARPTLDEIISDHPRNDSTSVTGHISLFSLDFLAELRREFGSEIANELRKFIRTGEFSKVEELLTKHGEDNIARNIEWNQKDAGQRSGVAYFSKLILVTDPSDVNDFRLRILNSLWGPWTAEKRASALNERQGRYNKTPLIYAARKGPAEVAKLFLQNGANASVKDVHGDFAFTYAIRRDDPSATELCRLFLDHDPKMVNERSGHWNSVPLIEAIRYRRSDVIDLLSKPAPPSKQIVCATDPNLPDREGDAALAWCYWQWPSMVKTLLDKFPNIDPHQRNHEGSSPLMIAYADALSDPDTPSARDMFQASREKMRRYEGSLMLSHAIYRKNANLVKFLLEMGADPCSKDDAGRSQIELAALCGNLDLFKLLRNTRAIPKEQLKRVSHACILYAGGTRDRVLEELITMDIKLQGTDLDMNGWTARDCATYGGDKKVLKKLMKLKDAPPKLPSGATLTKRGHIPPTSWAVSHDNPFLNAQDCLLGKYNYFHAQFLEHCAKIQT